jgi:hypothetical protein
VACRTFLNARERGTFANERSIEREDVFLINPVVVVFDL